MNVSRPRCPFPALFAAAAALLAAALPSLHAQEPRLANVSTLSRVGPDALTAGFFISGSTPKQVVIRAVAQRLAASPFFVPNTLADPLLTVYGPNSSSVIVATNDNWNIADAAAFESVGAFALEPGSRDAAIVASLEPGAYTARVTGVGGASGAAIVEVYEIGSPSSKFTNLSTLGQVGGAAGVLTPGFVIKPGGGMRKLLIRAAGPALTPAPFNVAGAIPNPTLTVFRLGPTVTTVASNDNWGTPVGAGAATASVMSAAFAQAGAFAFASGSNDAAVLVDLGPGDYTVQVSDAGNASGSALAEVYDLSPVDPVVVTIAATKSATDESGAKNGEFVFTRTGSTLEPLTVKYGVGGSAVNGFDFVALPGTVVIPAGESSVKLPLLPNPDLQSEGVDTVVVTVLVSPAYVIGPQSSATATITDGSATLYVASIRPESTATTSTASGTATILLSADGTLGTVNFSVSNLSSAITSAHLRIGPTGDFVFTLPYQASGSSQWLFAPVGNYTSGALLEALKTGNIYVGIDTAKYPSGELRGTFVQGTGSSTFTAPATPPPVALTGVTATDAARFLTQATFGPKRSEIDALAGGSLSAWLDQQFALPFTSHRAAVQEDHLLFGGSASTTNFNAIHPPNRQAAWWKVSLTAPDQLRQRVAFALSEIFVVSDASLGDDSRAEPLANYYDILGNNAFGNFRTLLEQVSLNPMMAEYLSSLRNAKADPVAGTTPDENYAREVMQLFTIGLVQLQPDGTLVLGADGLPIPTYNQKTITEMAKVFTGWAYPSTSQTLTTFRSGPRNYFNPLQLYAVAHDDTAKDLSPVLNTPIPASQGGTEDLRMALDALFLHPNTPPFIARRLIQRLVTSNPSPAYVYRVAQVFVNDGTGTRGNLAEVVRAILTDFEARSPDVAANPSYGKLKEPILRLTGFLRAFNSTAQTGRYSGHVVQLNGANITSATTYNTTMPAPVTITGATGLTSPQGSLGQAPLRSPTVFNFFSPDYVLPGTLAAAGLVVPEFEITDDTYATLVPNLLRTFVFASNVPPANPTPTQLTQATTVLMPDYAYEQTLVNDVPALLDHLSLVLVAGRLSPEARTRITSGLAALPTNASALDRARSAVLLVITSPNAAVQR